MPVNWEFVLHKKIMCITTEKEEWSNKPLFILFDSADIRNAHRVECSVRSIST